MEVMCRVGTDYSASGKCREGHSSGVKGRGR
jgi:hypothetical protein